MEQTYEYAWIIPFIPLPVPMLIGAGLILFSTATKRFRRMWAFQSVLLLSIVMNFSIYLSIQQINSRSVYQYVWSWIMNNDFSLDFGYLIDPLTYIMSILITTVGIMVLIYSDNYMAHDQGYLRFFAAFNQFEGRQCNVTFHKGFAYLIGYVSKNDKEPHVWGEFSKEEILSIGEKARSKKKANTKPVTEILQKISECQQWLDVYSHKEIIERILYGTHSNVKKNIPGP